MNIIQIRFFCSTKTLQVFGDFENLKKPRLKSDVCCTNVCCLNGLKFNLCSTKVLCLNRLKFILSVAQKFAVWIDWNSDCLLHKSLLFECLLKFRCLLHKSLLFECTEQQTAKIKATTKFPIPKHKWGNRLTMQNRDSSPLHMLLGWSLYLYQPTMKGIIWPSIHQCRIHWKPIIWSVMDKPRLDYQGSSNLLCKPSNFHLT